MRPLNTRRDLLALAAAAVLIAVGAYVLTTAFDRLAWTPPNRAPTSSRTAADG